MINIEFARKYQLQKTEFTISILKAVENKQISIYGIWTILIVLKDSRNIKKIIKQFYIAVDRDLRFNKSPVLLFNTILIDYCIILVL